MSVAVKRNCVQGLKGCFDGPSLPFPSSLPLFPHLNRFSVSRRLYLRYGGVPRRSYKRFHSSRQNKLGPRFASSWRCSRALLAARLYLHSATFRLPLDRENILPHSVSFLFSDQGFMGLGSNHGFAFCLLFSFLSSGEAGHSSWFSSFSIVFCCCAFRSFCLSNTRATCFFVAPGDSDNEKQR